MEEKTIGGDEFTAILEGEDYSNQDEFYSPHQDDFEKLIDQFISEVFIEKETSSKVNLKFGIYANAQLEPDIEERFVRAKAAADSVENDLDRIYGVYEFS